MPVAGLLSAPPIMRIPFIPMKPLPSPNITPQPIRKNAREESAKTMKFFDRILTAFLTRHMPDSTSAKPAFIQKTRKPVISVHTVSSATLLLPIFALSSATWAARSGAGVAAGA